MISTYVVVAFLAGGCVGMCMGLLVFGLLRMTDEEGDEK